MSTYNKQLGLNVSVFTDNLLLLGHSDYYLLNLYLKIMLKCEWKKKRNKKHCCDRKTLHKNPQSNKPVQEHTYWYSCSEQCRDKALDKQTTTEIASFQPTVMYNNGFNSFFTIYTVHHVVDSSNYLSATVAGQVTSSGK